MQKLLAVLLLTVGACGSHDDVLEGNGVLTKQTRDVGAFHAIEISQNLSAEVAPGPVHLEVEMDDNLVSSLSIRVEDGILFIEPAPSGPELRPTPNARIRITAPALDRVEAAGASSIVSSVETPRLAVTATGTSRVTVHATDRIEVTATDAAYVNVLGQPPARSLTITDAARVSFQP